MNRFSSHPAERRQSHRLAIHDRAQLKLMLNDDGLDGDAIKSVTLTDISREGLMASDAGRLLPGTRIILEVPLIGWREAEVMWIAENRAGCRFDVPLSLEELRIAAVSSERLAGECPDFATAIAQLTLEDGIAAALAPESAGEPGSSGPWGAILLVGALALVSFIVAMFVLDRLDL